MQKIIILIILAIVTYSCKNETSHKKEKKLNQDLEIIKKDSISIYLHMPAKTSIGINTWKKPYDEFYLNFENNSSNDSIILKKIPLIYDNNVMLFRTFIDGENNELIMVNNFFTANKENLKVELAFDGKEVHYLNESESNSLTSDILIAYNKFSNNKESEVSNNITELETIYSFYKNKSIGDNLNTYLNNLNYIEQLQQVDPNNKSIKDYLTKNKKITINHTTLGLSYNYLKNRVDTLDYEDLDSNKYSQEYLEILSIGAYRFLKDDVNKGDLKYKQMLKWFKSTDFYQRDSTYIQIQINALNKNEFKNYLKAIVITDIYSNEISIAQTMEQKNSEYYLIDFWATWCKPCIKGVKAMNEMNLPPNVEVISISIDKEKDFTKWKSMTKELKQKKTYWINNNLSVNKDFIEFAGIKSIPRYILIDQNMNLLDQAFYHPQDVQFLSELNNLTK